MKQKSEGMIQMPEFPGQNASDSFYLFNFYSAFLDAPGAVFTVTISSGPLYVLTQLRVNEEFTVNISTPSKDF